MNDVDPKHFRKRFLAAAEAIFDAAEKQAEANNAMAEALDGIRRISGGSLSAALYELATEPRRVCAGCPNDFMASDTGRELCPECIRRERMAEEGMQ